MCHATYKAFFRKNPTYWDYYIMSNSLTCIIAHLNGGICIVIRYKHNLIHLFIQSLNPILKILKFKYLQIRHKNLVTNWPQRHNLFHKNPLTARPPWQLVTPEISHEYWGCSSNSPPLTHGDQILHPLEDSDNQISSSLGQRRCQMPEVCQRGGGMLKLRFDRYVKLIVSVTVSKHKKINK